MKKVVSRALLFFAILFSLLSVYFFMLPQRSEEQLVLKVADSSDSDYQRDQIKNFQAENDKKIAEELNAVHRSECLSLSLIHEAMTEFGPDSYEVKNLVALKDYQDSVNLSKVTNIINKYGWPGAERIGAQNNYTLFTTIQNADLQTQQKFIPVMEKAVKKGTLSPEHFANLIDRKALTELGFQIFGTQYTLEKGGDKIIFSPIADEKNVNERRKEIGMEPLVLSDPRDAYFIKNES